MAKIPPPIAKPYSFTGNSAGNGLMRGFIDAGGADVPLKSIPRICYKCGRCWRI